MGNLDLPGVLIVLGLLGGAAWAIYNWLHPHRDAASTSEVVARFLKLSVKKRAATLPSRPTTKTVGHATPVFSSATPKARIAVCLVSERSG